MIDRATVNLYGCCKCNYKWISGWDTSSNKERPIPGYCPKCKNVRWNQKYTKEEDSLFDTLLKQHIVSKKSEVDEYSRFVAETTGRQISQIVVYIDYIAHLFLFGIKPFPDMFELKQILEIPKSNIEERHDLMLSIIEDRVRNAVKYENDRYFKQGKYYFFEQKKSARPNLFSTTYSPEYNAIKAIQVKKCKHAAKYKLLSNKLDKIEQRRTKEKKQKDEAEYRQRQQEENKKELQREEYLRKEIEAMDEAHRIRELRDNAKQLEELEIERNK